MDLDFLLNCQLNNVIPTFLRFRVANNGLLNSTTYTKCQLALLKKEILIKKSHLRTLTTSLENLKKELESQLSSLDFTHVCSLFLVSNDKSLKKKMNIQNKKLQRLVPTTTTNGMNNKNDPAKVIFNFSSYVLSDSDKSLLLKGLNFAIPPKNLEYSKFLLPFELLYREIKFSGISADEFPFLKAKLQDTALSSYMNFKKDSSPPSNLSKEEFESLLALKNQNDLIFQKADKGNTIVILDKSAYTKSVELLIQNPEKFEKLNIQAEKELNFLINLESKLKSKYLSMLKNKFIDEVTYSKICPTGSRPGVLYGLAKVHKPTKNGLPPFRPILSAIGTPTYNLAKFLVPLLSEVTTNSYSVKDSFNFANEILSQNAEFHMASLDVDSLFTNIPLDEAVKICVERLYSNDTNKINGIPKSDFQKLLELATKESFFLFNGSFYKQIDGVSMGSPLGPTLANAFLCFHEDIWLKECPEQFKPIFYRRYVDDIFLLFSSSKHLEPFKTYMNSRHKNMNFTSEEESLNTMPFLDIQITRENGKFNTNIYHKPTFSGVYTNFESFIPTYMKRGLIFSLLFRTFDICSDFKRFHVEIQKLKDILQKNQYPLKFIDLCIKSFLDKKYEPKNTVQTVPKKDVYFKMPYLGKISFNIRKKLRSIFSEKLPHYNLKIIFTSSCRLQNLFHFKDRIPKMLRSGIVYKFECGGCNATYYGKTKRHLKVRMSEHLGISHLTGKKVKISNQPTAVFEHSLFCDSSPSFENFTILTSEVNDFKLTLMESLLINRDKPLLNKTIKSMPLELF